MTLAGKAREGRETRKKKKTPTQQNLGGQSIHLLALSVRMHLSLVIFPESDGASPILAWEEACTPGEREGRGLPHLRLHLVSEIDI